MSYVLLCLIMVDVPGLLKIDKVKPKKTEAQRVTNTWINGRKRCSLCS